MNYLQLDRAQFNFKEGVFCGRESTLVNPRASDGDIWTPDNLHNRSAIYDNETGELLSCSFFKFFNNSQAQHLYPDPNDFTDWYIESKEDGSTCIVDYHNNQFNIRTRGCISYLQQDNRDDFEELPKLYPKAYPMISNNKDYTFLFEILTPNRRIVLPQKKIDFIFIGAINKKTLTYLTPQELDTLAIAADLKRPKRYQFSTIKEICETVTPWEGIEGVVLNYNNGQNKVKFKSDWYKLKHRLISGFTNIKNLIEMFVKLGCPSEQEFFNQIKEEIDFETASDLEPQIKNICDSFSLIKEKQQKCRDLIERIKGLSRKEQALDITQHYSDWRRAYSFSLLDGREMDDKMLAKVIEEYCAT